MRGHADSQLDNSPIWYDGFAPGEIDLDVVIIEKYTIERVDGLVHGLLGGKEQSSPVWIVAKSPPFLRCGDHFQQVWRQQFGRLDVYSHCCDVALHGDGRNGDPIVVRQGTAETCRPNRCSRWALRQCAVGTSESRQQLTADDTSGTARAPHFDERRSN